MFEKWTKILASILGDPVQNHDKFIFPKLIVGSQLPTSQAVIKFMNTNIEIDNGDEGMGATYDAMVYVDCPKCDRIMDQRLIEQPNRIRFELCPTCNSAFLDAGEFRLYTKAEYLPGFLSLLPDP